MTRPGCTHLSPYVSWDGMFFFMLRYQYCLILESSVGDLQYQTNSAYLSEG